MNQTIYIAILLYIGFSIVRVSLLYFYETLPNGLIFSLLVLEGPAGWAVLLVEGMIKVRQFYLNKTIEKRKEAAAAMERYYQSYLY